MGNISIHLRAERCAAREDPCSSSRANTSPQHPTLQATLSCAHLHLSWFAQDCCAMHQCYAPRARTGDYQLTSSRVRPDSGTQHTSTGARGTRRPEGSKTNPTESPSSGGGGRHAWSQEPSTRNGGEAGHWPSVAEGRLWRFWSVRDLALSPIAV